MFSQLPKYVLFLIPLISSLVGYVTNWVAIKMLFRPLKEKRIFGIRIPFTPGLIPRKRMELAQSIGRSVAEHLVTRESVAQRIEDDQVKAKIELLVYDWTHKLINRDLGSLDSLILEDFRAEWEEFLENLPSRINHWIYRILKSKQLKNLIRNHIRGKLEELAEAPINETVPRKLLDEIPSAITASIKSFTEGKEVEDKIEDFVNRKVEDILEEDKKLDAYIPEDLKVAIYGKLEDLLPFILNRLVGVLEDEQVRKRIKIYLYDLVDKLIEDTFDENSVWDQLKLGLMESLVMSTEEIKLNIDKGVDEGIPQVTQVIKQPEVKQRIYESLVASVDSFLEKKVSELNLKDETVDKVKENSAAAILGLLRSKIARVHLSSFLAQKLMRYSKKSPQEIMPKLTQRGLEEIPERVTEYLLSFLWGKSTRQDISDLISGQLQKLAHKPIGKISDYIPDSFVEKGRQKATHYLIELLKRETPKIVEAINISDMVSEKVEEFSPRNMERLVLGVTGNQLKAITWFGAILGFLIGIIQIGVIFLGLR